MRLILLLTLLLAGCSSPTAPVQTPRRAHSLSVRAAAGSWTGEAYIARLSKPDQVLMRVGEQDAPVEGPIDDPRFVSRANTVYVDTYGEGDFAAISVHAYPEDMVAFPGTRNEYRSIRSCVGGGYGYHVSGGVLRFGKWVFFDITAPTFRGVPLIGDGPHRFNGATVRLRNISPDSTTLCAVIIDRPGAKPDSIGVLHYRRNP